MMLQTPSETASSSGVLPFCKKTGRMRSAKKAGRATHYEAQRSKTLYRRITKLIHPDINPETDRQEQLQLLWHRTQIAYGHNDGKELSEIEVLVRKALKDLGAEEIRIEIPDIRGRIKDLKREIRI